ncbi:MAG TPA: ABC transporter permease [Bacillota bacterium]|nr:ABC transporter permease [Bacillota bacterium]
MTFIHIAAKDLRLLLRDRKALLTLIGTPLLLTLVLGTALANIWTSETPPSRVLWINQDEGLIGQMLFDEVFTIPDIAAWVTLEEVNDQAAASEMVRQGQATVLITVPQGFSVDVASGDATLSIYRDPGSSIRADVITQIAQRFAMELSMRRAVYTALSSQGLMGDPQQIEAALASVAISVESLSLAGAVAGPNRNYAPMDYYAASMGIMYLLFAVSHGATTFLREREGGTLARMYQSPVKAVSILGGKFVGIFLVALTQMTGIVIFTALVYRVSWGNPMAAAALIISAATAASGLGVLIAAVSKTAAAADALGTMIVLPMSVLGGSMMPLFAMPPAVRSLSRLTINGWALEGFTRVMFESAGLIDVSLNCIVLFGAGLVLLLVGGIALGRRGVTQ